MQVTRGAAPRLHAFPSGNVPPTIFIAANPLHPSARFEDKTITAILVPDVRWARCDIKSISLVANVLARQRAIDAGVREAIFVRNGVVMEGTASNLFAVFGGEVYTHPKTNYLLPGVTRDVVLSLCAEQDVIVHTVPILEQDIHNAQEIFVTSTTMEVMPVVELDHRPVADGAPGPVTLKLRQAFKGMVAEFLKRQKSKG
jgi:D-alanine transaminase